MSVLPNFQIWFEWKYNGNADTRLFGGRKKTYTRPGQNTFSESCMLFIDESNTQTYCNFPKANPQPVILKLGERAADSAWKIVCIQSIQFYMFCVRCHNGWLLFSLAKYAFYSFHFKLILIAFDQTFNIMHTHSHAH